MVVKYLAMPFGSYYLPGNLGNFGDFMIFVYLNACPRSCSENGPHCNRNVRQMAFFSSFNPLLSPPSLAVW